MDSLAVANVGATEATVTALVNPHGSPTTCWVSVSGLTNHFLVESAPLTGTNAVQVSVRLTGLHSLAPQKCQLTAVNERGTNVTDTAAFSTKLQSLATTITPQDGKLKIEVSGTPSVDVEYGDSADLGTLATYTGVADIITLDQITGKASVVVPVDGGQHYYVFKYALEIRTGDYSGLKLQGGTSTGGNTSH